MKILFSTNRLLGDHQFQFYHNQGLKNLLKRLKSIEKREVHIDELSPFSKQLLGEMDSTFTKSKALICDHSSQKDWLISLNM